MLEGNAQTLSYDREGRLQTKDVKLTLLPYYAWAHRGAGKMMVWFPQDLSAAKPAMPASIASKSKVEASHRTTALTAISDRLVPADESDRSVPYYHWWPKKNSTEWITYTFQNPTKVGASTVYWFDDAPWGGCRVPKAWKLYYQDEQGEWQPVTGVKNYGTAKGVANTVDFEPVITRAMKLEVVLPDDNSAGVFEWEMK